MRLSLRFIIPLFLALGAFAYAVVPLVDRLTLQWFVRDLDIRATLIANTIQEPVQDLVRAGNRTRMVLLPVGPGPADRDPDAAGRDSLRRARKILRSRRPSVEES